MLPPASGCRHALTPLSFRPLRLFFRLSMPGHCAPSFSPKPLPSLPATSPTRWGNVCTVFRLTALAPTPSPKGRCDAGPLCSGKWRRPLHSLRAACGPRRGGDGSEPLKPQARFRVRLSRCDTPPRCSLRVPSTPSLPFPIHSAPCIITALCLCQALTSEQRGALSCVENPQAGFPRTRQPFDFVECWLHSA